MFSRFIGKPRKLNSRKKNLHVYSSSRDHVHVRVIGGGVAIIGLAIDQLVQFVVVKLLLQECLSYVILRCLAVLLSFLSWVEQFWNSHLRKFDRKVLKDFLSTKIAPLENFPIYGILYETLKTN